MNTKTQIQPLVATAPAGPEGISLGPPPQRRPFSLRRTASQQSHFPAGLSAHYEMICRARDMFTGEALEQATTIGEDWLTAQMRIDTVAQSIAASRHGKDLAGFAGLRVGGPLRKAVIEAMPEEIERATRLFRMIDDMAGGAFLSGASWQTWLVGGIDAFAKAVNVPSMMDYTMEGTCMSYRPGSPALLPDGRQNEDLSIRSIGFLAVDPAGDPEAWHRLEQFDGPNQARVRYTDVWRADGKIHVMFGFQDSAAFAGTQLRRLFHEYRGRAVIDPERFVLEKIEMEYGSLPYAICTAAAATPQQLVGRSVREFRTTVIDVLKGTAGCTHLNDSLRTLQDVPALVEALDECLASP